jgi:hypothetical protein
MASTKVLKNIGLDDSATGFQTFNDDEPTAASFNDEVFVTGNVYASRSSDGGATWAFIDPFTSFPVPATGGPFCCDQVTLHERSRNLWLWLLQYRSGPTGANIFRLAASTSGKPEGWVFWDFAPGGVAPEWATNVMFDFPHMATSNNHLYISYNVFTVNPPPGAFQAAVVFKVGLDALAQKDLTGAVEVFRVANLGSLCLTRGATTDMFFGSHLGVAPLQVFRWPDAPGSGISKFTVMPSPWNGSFKRGQYQAPGPGGEWLAKLDARVTGAWVVGNEAGFLWAALPGDGRPRPYVRAVIVDTGTQQVVAQPDIFSPDFAWAYPAAYPNADGQVGLSVCFGGGSFNPGHAVGFLDGHQWAFPFAQTRASTHGPRNQVWGDYLSVTPHNPNATDWVASGFTLQGGNDLENIEPRYVEFAVGP